jgi:polar amino acid transport system substrate-binding protein
MMYSTTNAVIKPFVGRSARALLGATLLACVAAFGHVAAHAETTLERIQRTGEIRIGYANEKPFAYSEADGTVTGESPEIMKVVMDKMGVKNMKPVLTEWGGLIPGLLAGRYDVIAAGMYVTPERAKQVLFTDPHYKLGDGLLVAKGNPKNLKSYEDFVNNKDAKLAVMAGTVQYHAARDAGVPEDQILQVPSVIAQLQSVRSGRADAAAATLLTARELADKGGDRVEVISDFDGGPGSVGYGALAFRKSDEDLRNKVNAILKEWVGTEEHLKTVAPFGFDEANLPDKTVEELISQQ